MNNNENIQIGKVVWNGSIWVAVGNGESCTIMFSYDGITWNGVSGSKSFFDANGGGMDIIWNGALFVAVGAGNSTYIVTSEDGMNWSNSGEQ